MPCAEAKRQYFPRFFSTSSSSFHFLSIDRNWFMRLYVLQPVIFEPGRLFLARKSTNDSDFENIKRRHHNSLCWSASHVWKKKTKENKKNKRKRGSYVYLHYRVGSHCWFIIIIVRRLVTSAIHLIDVRQIHIYNEYTWNGHEQPIDSQLYIV